MLLKPQFSRRFSPLLAGVSRDTNGVFRTPFLFHLADLQLDKRGAAAKQLGNNLTRLRAKSEGHCSEYC